MTRSCCVRGCQSQHGRSGDEGIRFFRFPTWKRSHGPQLEEITKRRRMAWLSAVMRKDLIFNKTFPHMCVCSRHFHKGEPAYEMMESDPDWAPSLHLGHTFIKPTDPGRSARRRAREQTRKQTLQSAETGIHQDVNTDGLQTEETCDAEEGNGQLEVGKDGEKNPQQEIRKDGEENQEHPQLEIGEENPQLITNKEVQNPTETVTQPECDLCVLRRAEVNRLTEENIELRRKLNENMISDSFFGADDEKVKYYTGLPNLATFLALFNFLLPLMSYQKKCLTPFQMLLFTLMRLRLDLPLQHLAYLFHISPRTAQRTFHDMVSCLYANLRRAIIWPDRDTLRKVMPHQFKEAFGNRVAVIIDCFEIFTEKPSHLKARAQMFSSYKHNYTMKYLIGVTPKGAICFLSKGWGGRTSDKHITLNSGFLDNLLPGDLVLADRGFDIQECVGMLCAEVKLPAFTKGHCQLAARDVEETRKIAHLRIHVERVIGNVCQKYKILNGTIPISMVLPCAGEEVTFLDKVVTVCCALTNHCPTVV
ncbi:uncharacterized protein LOC119783441 [Cyprinodon tularosa]|uniref:uncharacterized protein LOC119783441 n=1 Tax=Cyprinodon tularosa TaxID=77115 RepID=UPI0018E1F390|nr:uncharacterized protein LOC119783441 [Cyprinodon tularosa]